MALSAPGASSERKYGENSNVTINHVSFVQINDFKIRFYIYNVFLCRYFQK